MPTWAFPGTATSIESGSHRAFSYNAFTGFWRTLGDHSNMWLFCCGMPRSGSTVQFQITADLVETAGLGRRVQWVRPADFPALQKKYADSTEWLVFKNHTYTRAMAAEFEHENARAIYVYRDLRDVMVSLMHKYDTSFEKLWQSRYLSSCLYNYRQWTGQTGTLVSRYEDMIADLGNEVDRIAAHLSIPCTPEQRQVIADRYGIEQQRKRIAAARDDGLLQSGFGQDRFDPHSNLHFNHIGSGTSGEWRQFLDGQQVALLEALGKHWLPQHGYTLTSSPRRLLLATLQVRAQDLKWSLRRKFSPGRSSP